MHVGSPKARAGGTEGLPCGVAPRGTTWRETRTARRVRASSGGAPKPSSTGSSQSPAKHSAGPGACAWPPTTRSERRSSPSTRRCTTTALPPTGATNCRICVRLSAARSSIRQMERCSLRVSCVALPGSPRQRELHSRSTPGSSRWTISILTEMTDEETTTEPIQQALDAFLVELLGRMPTVTHRWAGIFGLTQDLLPLVGPVPGRDGTWVAAGYSGHGNVLGFMCGELVAAAVLGGEDPLLDLFSPARFLVSG